MSLIVKICGLSTPETLDVALDAGADMVGFMFFPASPRHLGLGLARDLAARVKGRARKVAVSVDADDQMLENCIEAVEPDLLQLHGKETIARVRDIKTRFKVPVMKVIAVQSASDLAGVAGYAAVVDQILFDTKAPKDATRPGGLGVPFDWHLLDHVDRAVPFLVSGGVNAGNVAEALRITRAPGVDVSSGVETAPGVKDPDLIRAFIRAARAAESAPASKSARSA
jgi:phosphoribosylanthranilate isomerase